MLFLQRLASLNQFLLYSLATLEFANRLDQSSGVLGAPEKVCSFLQGLIVIHRHHYHRSFTLASNSNWGMIIAHLRHCLGKVVAGRGVAYTFHSTNPVHVHKIVRSISAHNKSINFAPSAPDALTARWLLRRYAAGIIE
jgi:hypothetical protein